MCPIIEAGAVQYDDVCPPDYMIQKMAENELLQELNFENIPNLQYID
jgi:spermidine/putrescine-binding protein